jgi:hypothetical protein
MYGVACKRISDSNISHSVYCLLLVFNIFTNDVCDSIHSSKYLLSADDMKCIVLLAMLMSLIFSFRAELLFGII